MFINLDPKTPDYYCKKILILIMLLLFQLMSWIIMHSVIKLAINLFVLKITRKLFRTKKNYNHGNNILKFYFIFSISLSFTCSDNYSSTVIIVLINLFDL